MTDPKAVGIDLGTTNSAVAWVAPSGRSEMVRNAEGELLTPSVVLFDDADLVVGKDARKAAIVYPDRVAEWVKRDMGSSVYSRPIRGRYLPPEVIQASILRKLRADLVAALGPEASAVITVPAYFDEPRRKATADAGEMAGLRVLDIVNEPTAAALAFGELLGYLAPTGGTREEMTVLVYDLGGGTFDVTLLRLGPGEIRTLATDGDVQLGGHDWDMRLVDRAAESFKETHGADPRGNPAALNRLYSEVVDAKHALSARMRATIRVEHAGYTSQVEVRREEFEELTADLLERTAYTTRELLVAARLEWSRVSRVLLVGGSTRMPMVSRMLHQMSGISPDHTVNPDEAVARGAALYAGYLLARQAPEGPGPAFDVINVNSHSLGVEGIDPETFRKINVVLIPRNTPLPARFTERFVTRSAGQQSIVVQVLEGESSLPGECTAIGRTVIRDLPAGLPQGWPVEVTFEYAANGRLSVRAAVPGTHREVTLDLERDVGLSHEGISRWRQTVAASPGFDAFEAMVADVLQAPGSASAAVPGLAEKSPSPWASGPERTSPSAGPPVPPSAAGSTPPLPAAGQGPQPLYAWPPESSLTASPDSEVPTETFQPADAPGGDGFQMVAGPQPPGGPPPTATPGPPPPGAELRPASAPPADATHPGTPARGRHSRLLINLIGFIVSGIVGLTLGYLLIKWLLPDSGILDFW